MKMDFSKHPPPPAWLTHPVRFPSSAWLTSGLTIIINRAHSLIISSHISPVKYLRSVFYFYFNCHYFYHRTIFFDNLVSPPSHQLSDISLLDFQTGTVWPILPALKSKHRCVIWSRQACCFHFSFQWVWFHINHSPFMSGCAQVLLACAMFGPFNHCGSGYSWDTAVPGHLGAVVGTYVSAVEAAIQEIVGSTQNCHQWRLLRGTFVTSAGVTNIRLWVKTLYHLLP